MNSKQQLILIVLVLGLLCAALTGCTEGFTEIPSSQEVFVGEAAVFRCRHPAAFAIGWNVNGSSVVQNPSADIIRGTDKDDDGADIDILTIIARPEYNGTEVVCVAFFNNGRQPSPPAVLLVSSNSSLATPGFTKVPTNLIVAEGVEAVFHCQHPTAVAVTWRLNGTILLNSILGGVFATSVSTAGGIFNSLTITAYSSYNQTQVECVAYFDDSPIIADTDPVNLTIQGKLAAVGDLRRNLTTVMWNAPFSLNLTSVIVDIVYCVEVYNITCGRSDLIVSDCNVTEPSYTADNIAPHGYIYEYIVTHRSNVGGARNGTPSQPHRERFSRVNFCVNKGTSTQNAQVNFTITEPSLPVPNMISVLLQSIDNIEDRWYNATVVKATGGVPIVIEIPPDRLWNCTVLAYGCAENELLNGEELSTHDIQNISVSSSIPGQIRVTGNFIKGSTAVGLLIAVVDKTGSRFHNVIKEKSSKNEIEGVIMGITGGSYAVSVFVLNKCGNPFERAAKVPINVCVEEGKDNEESQSIKYTLQSIPTGVCITCTFLDSSTTDCVAVVHQQISRLSSSGLMNIESSHKFNRSGDTAYGCISKVNLDNYQIEVIDGQLIIPRDFVNHPQNNIGVLSLVPVIILVVLGIFVVIPIIMTLKCKCRKKQVCHKDFPQDIESNPYSTQPMSDTKSVPASLTEVAPLPVVGSNTEPVYDEATCSRASIPPSHDKVEYSDLKGNKNKDGIIYTSVDNSGSRKCKAGALREDKPDDLHKTESDYAEIQHNQQVSTTVSSVPSSDNKPAGLLPMLVTSENLLKELWPVHTEWKNLISAMSLSDNLEDEIFTNNANDELCFCQVLDYYMCNHDKRHDWEEIVSILKDLKADKLAEEICARHVYPYQNERSQPVEQSISDDNDCTLERMKSDENSEPALNYSTNLSGELGFPGCVSRGCSVSETFDESFHTSTPIRTQADINDDSGGAIIVQKGLVVQPSIASPMASKMYLTPEDLQDDVQDEVQDAGQPLQNGRLSIDSNQRDTKIVHGFNQLPKSGASEAPDRKVYCLTLAECSDIHNSQKEFVSQFGPTKEQHQDSLCQAVPITTCSSSTSSLQQLMPTLKISDKLNSLLDKASSLTLHFLSHQQNDSEKIDENLSIEHNDTIEVNVSQACCISAVSVPTVGFKSSQDVNCNGSEVQTGYQDNVQIHKNNCIDEQMFLTLNTGQIRCQYGDPVHSISQPTVKKKRANDDCQWSVGYPPLLHASEKFVQPMQKVENLLPTVRQTVCEHPKCPLNSAVHTDVDSSEPYNNRSVLDTCDPDDTGQLLKKQSIFISNEVQQHPIDRDPLFATLCLDTGQDMQNDEASICLPKKPLKDPNISKYQRPKHCERNIARPTSISSDKSHSRMYLMSHPSYTLWRLCVFAFVVSTTFAQSGFKEVPRALTVAYGTTAVFYCKHPQADTLGWKINGSLLNTYSIYDNCKRDTDGVSLCSLSITADESTNNTMIECFALPSQNVTNSVTLSVQGPLETVTHLQLKYSNGTLRLEYRSHFSLNLTHVSPDVSFCIDVFVLSNVKRNHIASNCTITNNFYAFKEVYPHKGDHYRFVITPRSNVAEAVNGTSAMIYGSVFYDTKAGTIEVDKDEKEKFASSAQIRGNDEAKGDAGKVINSRLGHTQRSRCAVSEPQLQAHRNENKQADSEEPTTSTCLFLAGTDDVHFNGDLKPLSGASEQSCDSILINL